MAKIGNREKIVSLLKERAHSAEELAEKLDSTKRSVQSFICRMPSDIKENIVRVNKKYEWREVFASTIVDTSAQKLVLVDEFGNQIN